MKKTFLTAIALSTVLALTFTGCSSNSNNTAAGNTQKKDVTLKFLIADDTSEGGAMAYMAQKYEKEKGIKVEMIEVPYEQLKSKLQTMIQGGDAPALVRDTGFKQYKDQLVDLSDIVDLSVIPKSVQAYMKVDNKVMAIPSNVTANGMLYNKTAFDKAGIKAPTSPDEVWTWDQFVTNVNKVVASGAVKYGMVMDHSQNRFQTLLYQFGGSIYDETGKNIVANNSKGVAALTFFKKLHDDGFMPKSVWLGTEDPSAMFKSGQVAVAFQGNWKISDYTQNVKNFQWGVMYMPKEETRSSVPGGNFIVAIKGSKVENQAKDFLKWFYSPEVYKEYCEKGNYMSSRTDVQPQYAGGVSDMYKIFSDELKNTPPVAGVDYTLEFSDLVGNSLRDNIDSALSGQKTPQKALDDFSSQLKTAMSSK